MNIEKANNVSEGVLSSNLFLGAFKVNINVDGRALIAVAKRWRW